MLIKCHLHLIGTCNSARNVCIPVSTPLLMRFTNEASVKYGQRGPTHSPEARGKGRLWMYFHYSFFITSAIVHCIRNKHVFGACLGLTMRNESIMRWRTINSYSMQIQRTTKQIFSMINPVSAIIDCSTAPYRQHLPNQNILQFLQKLNLFRLTHLQNSHIWINILSDHVQSKAQTPSSVGPADLEN